MTVSTVDSEKTAIEPEAVLDALRWRYAVKKFDPVRKIPDVLWHTLEGALVLSPSSYGLQPWRFFVVDDPALREKLKPASWNQPQVADAARLVVFAAKKDFGSADVDRLVARISEVRNASRESLEQYRQMMLGSATQPAVVIEPWIARQVYIALGFFLTSAALLGVDACPMEGIDHSKYNEILGLSKQGYTALCAVAAGYRAQDDDYGKLAKVRYPHSEVIRHL